MITDPLKGRQGRSVIIQSRGDVHGVPIPGHLGGAKGGESAHSRYRKESYHWIPENTNHPIEPASQDIHLVSYLIYAYGWFRYDSEIIRLKNSRQNRPAKTRGAVALIDNHCVASSLRAAGVSSVNHPGHSVLVRETTPPGLLSFTLVAFFAKSSLAGCPGWACFLTCLTRSEGLGEQCLKVFEGAPSVLGL